MSDFNYRSYWQEEGIRISGEQIPEPPVNPMAYDDVLKFSNCINSVVDNSALTGGREDCIDANRGEGLLIQDCELYPKGKNGVTVKGGFRTWIIKKCYFRAHGSECDVEVGQFSMYDKFTFRKSRTTGGAVTECSAPGDTRIIIKVWNADVPSTMGTRAKIVKIPWIVWFPYFCFRQLQVKFLNK